MHNQCCIDNCESRRTNVKLHAFPSRAQTAHKWLEKINSSKLWNLDCKELHKLHVCVKHFEKRFINPKTNRLRSEAYPSLFTEDELTVGVPSEDSENINPNIDHDYHRKRIHQDHSYTKLCERLSEGPSICKRPKIQDESFTADSKILIPQPQTSAREEPSISKRQKIEKELSTADPQIPPQIQTSARAMRKKPNLMTLPKTPGRRRLVQKVKNLTPAGRILYQEYRKSQKQLNFIRRVKRAVKFSRETTFQKLTEKMNPLSKKIMWMQIAQCGKKQKGRRFTQEEKLISLSIMKQSPKCYRFLRRIFILPSKTTLNKMIGELNIEAGINPQIFESIKQEVHTWKENKKYCSILFDEMSLEPGLYYNKHKDKIEGFVELDTKTNEFADHALAFMLRGAIWKWQQPVAYYFCQGATSGVQLKNIIKKIVGAVIETGLLPVALSCDQGSAFQSALKSLQEDTRREQILADENPDGIIRIDGHALNIIYDPPHLIKGLRNNFLTKDIKFNNQISKWSDIVDVYKTDCNHAQSRLLHKLTDEHVLPEKIKKMKVKNCTKVFSKTMAAALSYTAQFSHYADGTQVSQTLKNTAETVAFFDDLFDCVNGASLHNKTTKGKDLRKAVTANSAHHKFWKEAIGKLENLKFIDNKSGKEISVPSIKNWIVTLKSFQRLWDFFKDKNMNILRPRYFNSDPIENFFGQVRAYNLRNNDPDCHTFSCTYKSLLITRFIKFHSESFNCEDDSGEQLIKIKTLFENRNPLIETEQENKTLNQNLPETSRTQKTKIHSRAYTVGWVIRKIMSKNSCNQCNQELTSGEPSSIHTWITFKEYNKEIKQRLTYPSEQAVRCFGCVISEGNKFLETQPHSINISQGIREQILSEHTFELLTCPSHKMQIENIFLQITIKMTINIWCNAINKILKGTDIARLNKTNLPQMQHKAFHKYLKKLNKKLNK